MDGPSLINICVCLFDNVNVPGMTWGFQKTKNLNPKENIQRLIIRYEQFHSCPKKY